MKHPLSLKSLNCQPICVIFYNPSAVVRVIEIPYMKPVTVIWPEFIAVHVWYHLLALISGEKVASNWTYHSDDLQLFNNGRKEMDARSLR